MACKGLPVVNGSISRLNLARNFFTHLQELFRLNECLVCFLRSRIHFRILPPRFHGFGSMRSIPLKRLNI